MASFQPHSLSSTRYGSTYSLISREVDQVLLQSNHASEILRTLYCVFKGRQKKVSLTFICRAAGIPSKGYLALVMNGQRRLHVKYWDAIFRTFKLNDLQREILQAFLERELSNSEDSEALHFRRITALKAELEKRAWSLQETAT